MDRERLTHLQQLEAESIHIIREVAAEFENPVMMYSIGKDSSVMLHLARKAFYPGKIPFPLLHVDTNWKFKEMIKFRDETAKKYGLDLIVHKNPDGLAMDTSGRLLVAKPGSTEAEHHEAESLLKKAAANGDESALSQLNENGNSWYTQAEQWLKRQLADETAQCPVEALRLES